MTAYDELRGMERNRVFNMRQKNRLVQALGANLRLDFGWRRCEATDKTQCKINTAAMAEADRLLKYARSVFITGSKIDTTGVRLDMFDKWKVPLENTLRAAEIFEEQQALIAKMMVATLKRTPLAEFAEQTRGFGEISVAQLLAHVGDPTLQKSESSLIKRMGIACLEGKAQGRPGKGATADDWIAHGYNPSRRAIMFVIGDNLIRAGNDRYRAVYDRRKAIESARPDVGSKMHAHLRAHRKMESILLRDLYRFACRAARSEMRRAA